MPWVLHAVGSDDVSCKSGLACREESRLATHRSRLSASMPSLAEVDLLTHFDGLGKDGEVLKQNQVPFDVKERQGKRQ